MGPVSPSALRGIALMVGAGASFAVLDSVAKTLAATYGADDAPAMPSQPTFYRLVKRLAEGRHTFGSARTRRSLSKQPDGPFGAITVVRPGEMGTVADISGAAAAQGIDVVRINLTEQFRCGGSLAYVQWVERLLGLRPGGPMRTPWRTARLANRG